MGLIRKLTHLFSTNSRYITAVIEYSKEISTFYFLEKLIPLDEMF